MNLRASSRVSVVLLVAAGCAHAPAPEASSAAPELTWPAPPARPEIRFVGDWTTPRSLDRRSLLRKVFDAIVGLDATQDPEAPSLRRPFGVALSPSGDVLLADPDAPGVFRVSAEGSLVPVKCEHRAWVSPMALAYASDGALLVADAGAAEVVRVDAAGGCRSMGAGVLERPTGIAAASRSFYVADPPTHTVVELSDDGAVLRRFGARGAGDGELSFPTAVAIGRDGELLVVDALNFRVGRFAPDGRWLGSFGEPGETTGALARPKGIARSPDGRIFVADAQRDEVLVYLADGTFRFAIGSSGAAPGQFQGPTGLAIAAGRLAVADSLNARVQIFELLGGST
jgi:sugar lactone lactonase YvrE